MEIAFGVLAGGKSRRMGKDKKELTLNGKSFLERLLEAGSGFEERIVSLADECDADLEAWLTACGIVVVHDVLLDAGPLEGIRRILEASRHAAVLIAATDMPLLTAGFLSALKDSYLGTGNLVLLHGGRNEPLCSIYCRECVSMIDTLLEKQIRRPAALFGAIPTEYISVEELGFDPKILSNINDPGEYERLTKEYDRERR